jgi:hypothetical protein
MGRYKPDDFGYNFALKDEETESLLVPASGSKIQQQEIEITTSSGGAVTTTTSSKDGEKTTAGEEGVVASDTYKLYEENPLQNVDVDDDDKDYKYEPPKHNRGGESFVVSDDSMDGVKLNPMDCLGATCCCLTVVFLIAGGILIAYEKHKDELELLIGSILIVLAVSACVCGCCSLCIGSSSDSFDFGSGSKGDPNHKEVKVRLRRLNDRYEKGCMKAEDTLRRIRLDVVGHMKEVRILKETTAKIFDV